ncbi:hypothetical protein [Leucobacter iarius]|uniref:Lipopolysaccharide assembly protein A domain-containing protein n=1 Tax=Leucobacter iarius TaxID=333963 RepID=A0ABN2L9K8_9MICO
MSHTTGAPASTPGAESESKGLSARSIVAIVLLVIALLFVFSNLGSASVFFLGLALTMPAWIWFLVVLLIGVAVGSLFPWLRPRKSGRGGKKR